MNKRIEAIVEDIVKELSGTGGGAGGATYTPGTGEQVPTAKAFKKPKKENTEHTTTVKNNNELVDTINLEAELSENYKYFRNQTSKRSVPEQLHKAVKDIKTKLQEVNKLIDYTSRLKVEISESEESVKYTAHTVKALEAISEMIKQSYIKTKKLK